MLSCWQIQQYVCFRVLFWQYRCLVDFRNVVLFLFSDFGDMGGYVVGIVLFLSLDGREGLGGGKQLEMVVGYFISGLFLLFILEFFICFWLCLGFVV